MVSKEIELGGDGGLHLRPASRLSSAALEYKCRCDMIIDGKAYNIKSVLSVLSAQIQAKKTVTIRCEGADEEAALSALTACAGETKE